MNTHTISEISLAVNEARLPVFFELLAAGLYVDAGAGESIRSLLEGRLGLDADYVEANVQTVFLNGRAVDDFDQTLVSEDAVVALSSAMPGLVGAVFRRQSPLGSMRGVSAEAGMAPTEAAANCRVMVKLFNRVAADVGPDWLAAGVRVPAKRLADFLASHSDLEVHEAAVDGRQSGVPEILSVLKTGGEEVRLWVRGV